MNLLILLFSFWLYIRLLEELWNNGGLWTIIFGFTFYTGFFIAIGGSLLKGMY